jgi:glycosyltransferase involved in cell wall biosynthesis
MEQDLEYIHSLIDKKEDWSILPNKPLVSVLVATYNHEDYIKECIDGILMQKVNFDYEIIIKEDFSTDGTRGILLEYYKKYPNKIRLWLCKQNLYRQNLKPVLSQFSKGKYIAKCEGDDYWTDPLKLQKQVDLMEANEDYVLCFHDVKILYLNGEIKEDHITKVPQTKSLNQETLLRYSNFIHTPSVVFRNLIREFPQEMQFSPVGDYLLYVWLTNYGDIGYIPETMGIYRYGSGIHSTKSKEKLTQDWFWVTLVASFLVNNPEMVKIVDRKLLNFLKVYTRWSELTIDNRFPKGIKKFLDLSSQLYQVEKTLNVKDQSIRYLIYELRKRILNRIKQY